MRIHGTGRLRRTVRRLRNRLFPGALIVRYHRIADLPTDPFEQAVTPRCFAEQLEVLRKYVCPISLQQLRRALENGTVPRRAVVVTLDDGYADNLYEARPLLERYDIPATVFVSTGYLGQMHEFWWDELERLLLSPGTLPQTLCLNLNGDPFRWELGEASHYSEEAWRGDCGWQMLAGMDDPGPRQRLLRALHPLLRRLPVEERQKALQDLRAWAGMDANARPTHRALTPEELVRLADGGLIEIGGHTVTHAMLSALRHSAQRDEMQRCKARLEEIVHCPVVSFAYPYGDYTAESVAAVRETGFTSACTTQPAVVRRQADPYLLPRVWVRNWDGEAFVRKLENWFPCLTSHKSL